MAESIVDDLDELCINDTENTLTTNFTRATAHVQSIASTIDNKTLLLLYGYYKQATEGPCSAPKPSWYDMKAKSKWESWNCLGDMTPDEAKRLYIDIVAGIDPSFLESQKNPKNFTEGWITVSVLQNNDKDLDSADKSVIDYVKEGDIENVTSVFSTYDKHTQESILNNVDEDGLNILHWAADRGDENILKILLSYGANVNVTDSDNQTPLHYAASCGHIECVRILIENGADTEVNDNDGNDALAVANDEAVENLILNSKK